MIDKPTVVADEADIPIRLTVAHFRHTGGRGQARIVGLHAGASASRREGAPAGATLLRPTGQGSLGGSGFDWLKSLLAAMSDPRATIERFIGSLFVGRFATSFGCCWQL